MKVIDILVARDSLVKLIKVRFTDFKTTSAVYKLVKKVDSVTDMVQTEQKKIIDIYADKDEKGNLVVQNGNYIFSKPENNAKCVEEMNKLRNEEVTDVEKITIKLDSVQNASELSAEDIIKLEPVIDWV